MSTVTIQVDSVEYLFWPVSVTDDEGTVLDPTGDTVTLALRAVRDYTPLTFYPATWETDVGTPDTYFVQILCGTGNFVLDPGVYGVYVKVTDSPEVPILGPSELGYVYVAAG